VLVDSALQVSIDNIDFHTHIHSGMPFHHKYMDKEGLNFKPLEVRSGGFIIIVVS